MGPSLGDLAALLALVMADPKPWPPRASQQCRGAGVVGSRHPLPLSPEPVEKSRGGDSERTTTSPVMSLAPCPGSCRQKRCLFCCFIGLLGPKNWSSESWEPQHLVGTRKEAYFYRIPPHPSPLATTSLCLTTTGAERGCGFLSRTPAAPQGGGPDLPEPF